MSGKPTFGGKQGKRGPRKFSYTLKDVREVLGVSEGKLRRMRAAGSVQVEDFYSVVEVVVKGRVAQLAAKIQEVMK